MQPPLTAHLACLTSIVAALLAAPASAATLRTNLIVNPGFEQDEMSTSAPSGWTVTLGSPQVVDCGFDLLDCHPAGGAFFFHGGPATAGVAESATITQSIDVTMLASDIDAGDIGYWQSALFSSGASETVGIPEDSAELTIEFLNASQVSLETDTIGGLFVVDEFVSDSSFGLVPVGTRSIRVQLTATKVAEGDSNDGFADVLTLLLAPQAELVPTLGTPARLLMGALLLAVGALAVRFPTRASRNSRRL